MARFRQTSFRRGSTKIFKKRFLSFAQAVVNSTPTIFANLQMAETGTIVAAKVSIHGQSQSVDDADIQEVRLFLYCGIDVQPLTAPDPTVTGNDPYSTSPEIETINGFYVGSLFCGGGIGVVGDKDISDMIKEKFRFRRKCDRNSRVLLAADTIVRNGAAATVNLSGALYLTIQTR